MLAINIIIVLLFISLAILFLCGKGMWLIAGYNTLSKEEKEKYNEKALCACMAKMMFSLAVCWCVLGIGVEINRMWLFWVGFGLFLLVAFFFAIYMNTKNRLKK